MSGGSFVSPAIRERVRGWAVPIATALGRLGLTPNALTVIGFLGTCGAALAAAAQDWILAGILVLVFGIFDLFDGALARATGRVSKFGAFLDSTLDRTGENLVLVGVAVGCAAAGFRLGVALAALALAFASVVTYARAKAEVVGAHGEVGFAPREVRLVILAAGLIAAGVTSASIIGLNLQPRVIEILGTEIDLDTGRGWLALSLGLIALLSAITIVQRIVHVRHQLENEQ